MAIYNKIRFHKLFFILPFIFLGFDTPDNLHVNKILTQLANFRTYYPQQKVHLHTDKEVYLAPENIWIKAYLTNASTMLADSVSKEIYVDLIDFNNRHIRTILIRNVLGYGQGNMQLSDTLLEGDYQLRAYTNWMRNFDEGFFFTKTITVKNPNYENVITRKRILEVKQLNRQRKRSTNDISMFFMPEGGNLISGLPSKVAFKTENEVGEGIEVTGTVFSNKVKIADIQTIHEGMGYFMITPEVGKKYTCTINYGNKKKETFALPAPIPKGIVISTDASNKDAIKLIVNSNRDISQNIASNEIIIVAQSRNTILYVSKGELKGKPLSVEIPKKLFPSGIAQITIFDARLEPVCERLVFISPNAETSQNQIKLTKIDRADSSTYSIEINSNNGKPVISNLSASVSELLPDKRTGKSSILTNLLLTSDIKGHVKNPWHYFSGTEEAMQHADLVMLTHGWRRFVWKDVLANTLPKLTAQASLGVSIGGKITKDFFEMPVPDAKVRLTIKNSYNDVFETKADAKGAFMFSNLNYEDTIDVLIEAFKPGGGKGVLIVLSDTIVPKMVTPLSANTISLNYPKEKLKQNMKRERAEFKKNYKEREPDNQMFKIHQTPNDVLYVGEDAVNYSNILSYMQGRVPGVSINGSKVIIRGISTIYGSTDPLFLLDGIPIDPSSVSMLNPQDIAIIEVLKGPEASIYGSRGGNGVIAFYSKRGRFMKRGQIDFGMLGYHKVREYYTPNYDSWKYKPQDYQVPRSIYWKPELITDTQGKASFTFANKFGNIPRIITIEGLTKTGEIIWLEEVVGQ